MLVLGIHPAFAAPIALVAHTQIAGGGSGGVSPAITTTTATLLVASVSQFKGGTLGVITDKIGGVLTGNVWVPGTPQIGSAETYSRIFYCVNPTVGASHTFLCNGAASITQITAWSGVDTTSPYAGQTGNAVSSSPTIQPGIANPPFNGCLIITANSNDLNGGGTQTINSGFTITDQGPYSGGMNESGGQAYLIQTTKGAVNPTWTMTGSTTDITSTIMVFSPVPVAPIQTVNFLVQGSGGDIAPSLTTQVNFATYFGSDITYFSAGKTCSGTAADSSHIVLDASETSAVVGHIISDDTLGANKCYISAFNAGTHVATVTSLVGTPSLSATFNSTPQSGDGYTIYPSIPKLTMGAPSGGHTIWPGAYNTSDNTGWLKFSGIVTSPQCYIWVKGAGTRVYGRDAAGSWVDGTGPICMSNDGNHTAVWQIDIDNVLFEDIDTWCIGNKGPTAGDGCWASTKVGAFTNVIVRRGVWRGDNYSFDVDHCPLAPHSSTDGIGVQFQSSCPIGTSFYHQLMGPTFSAINCTIVNTANILGVAGVGGMTAGSAVLHLVSTAGIAAGVPSGGGEWVGHPNIPAGTEVLSVDSGTQVTLNANATGGGVVAGDSVYFGGYVQGEGSAGTAVNSAVFGFAGKTGTFTTCAGDYTAGKSGITTMLYANQFKAASGVATGAIDLTPKAGNGLNIGTGLSGNDLYNNPFVDSVGAVQFQAAATNKAGIIGGGVGSFPSN